MTRDEPMAVPGPPPVARRPLRDRDVLVGLLGAGLVVGAVLLLLVALPALFARYQTACAGVGCLSVQLTPVAEAELRGLGLSPALYALATLGGKFGSGLVFVVVGALILARRSDERMGRFTGLMLLSIGLAVWLTLGVVAAPVLAPALTLLNLINVALFLPFVGLFPDGRWVPGWTRLIAVAWPIWLLIDLAVSTALPGWAAVPSVMLSLALVALGLGAQAYRYRRVSGPVERLQARWLLVSLAVITLLALTGLAILHLSGAGADSLLVLGLRQGLSLSQSLIPIALGVAVLRYHLWESDPILTRTLVYTALTACVVTIYGLVVGTLSLLFRAEDNPVIALVATGVVAVLVQPLREQLQRGVSRLLYGDRDDPYAALGRLTRQLEATLAVDNVLPALVRTVRAILRLPYAAVLAVEGAVEHGPLAADGTPVAEPLRLPLVYQGEPVGVLLVSPRAQGEPLSADDRQLLATLAHQAGAALYSVRLLMRLQTTTVELQRAREGLVLAREEERRRLQRDLHDELAPALAGLGLTAGTIARMLPQAPEVAGLAMLLHEELRRTSDDVRRLVYNLRPPALDQLGLVAAIRERAAQFNAPGPDGLHVRVEAPDRLPPLPAAVEVAAYRIALEALMNVVRHAGARTCVIRLTVPPHTSARGLLELDITDDGAGMGGNGAEHGGLGLRSMRGRAEELGGSWHVEAVVPSGARVTARLPFSRDTLIGQEQSDG